MFRVSFRVIFSKQRNFRRFNTTQTFSSPPPPFSSSSSSSTKKTYTSFFTSKYKSFFTTKCKKRVWVWNKIKGHLFPTLSEDAIREFQVLKTHTGHKWTLGCIVAINIAVFCGWNIPSLYPFMDKYFVWKNDSFKKHEYWLLFTSSFSHNEFSHLLANMSLLLYLGKRLHQFMGRKYFLFLYLSAAVCGKIAATHEPFFRVDANFWGRYANILDGSGPNQQRALGASDCVCGLIAVWYLVFPRTPFHLFRRTHLLTEWLKTRHLFPSFTRLLDKYSPSASSLWLVPILFSESFLPALVTLPSNPHQPPHLVKGETAVSYFAHVGGALAGVLFHMTITSKIKSQFFKSSVSEIVNRCCHLVASLLFCSFISYQGISFAVGEKTKLSFQGAFAKAKANVDPILRVSYVECAEGPDSSINALVKVANKCAYDEARELAERLRRLLDTDVIKGQLPARGYIVKIEGSEYIAVPDSASELKYGRCDNQFMQLRLAKQSKQVDVPLTVASFHFQDPTLQKPKTMCVNGSCIQLLSKSVTPPSSEDTLEARILRSFFSHH